MAKDLTVVVAASGERKDLSIEPGQGRPPTLRQQDCFPPKNGRRETLPCPPHHFLIPAGAKVFRGVCRKCGERHRWDPTTNQRIIVSKLLFLIKGNRQKTVRVYPDDTISAVFSRAGWKGNALFLNGQRLEGGEAVFGRLTSGDQALAVNDGTTLDGYLDHLVPVEARPIS